MVNEEVQSIHVYKWNEELHKVKSSQGLFLFRVKDNLRNSDQFHRFTVFELVSLSNRDSIKELLFTAIISREEWLELVPKAIESREGYLENTIAKLRETVSEYLLGCIEFDIQLLPSLEKPIIVIVVDAAISKRKNGTGKRHSPFHFSSERQETKDSCDDSSTKDSCNDASTGSVSVKKRKVGDARAYKKEIRSRIRQRNLPHQEEADIRRILRSYLEEPTAFEIIPMVAWEPQGLSQVEVAVKEKEFDGIESEDVCSICLDGIQRGMKVVESPCSHIFHRDCLFRWLPWNSRLSLV